MHFSKEQIASATLLNSENIGFKCKLTPNYGNMHGIFLIKTLSEVYMITYAPVTIPLIPYQTLT